jgi:4-amino-4-deoxy-L-arabinose transferase-like glycosyltransferase
MSTSIPTREPPGTAARPDAQAAAADDHGMPAGTASSAWLWPLALWLAVTATTLLARPPMVAADLPTHATAWWAWIGRQDIGYLPNGGAEWPPLLFWSIRLGWSLFGVSETWARLVPSLFGLASLWLIAALARSLWPGDLETPRHAPIVLAGSGGFIALLATTMFAWPLLASLILALHGLALAWRSRPTRGWMIYATALALGELSAGAMAFWMMLPIALAAPLATRLRAAADLRRWYVGAIAATVIGLAVAGGLERATLPWPDGEVVASLFLRVPVQHAGLDQPWIWYVFAATLLLFPWLWWASLWRTARRARAQLATAELRLCLSSAVLICLVVLAIGRQTADLLPLLAPAALIIARIWTTHAGKARDFHAAVPGLLALFVCLFFFMLNIIPVAHLDAVWQRLFASDLPVWLGGISFASGIILLSGSYLLALLTPRASLARLVQLALLPVLLAITVNLEFAVALRPFFDLEPIALQIQALEKSGRPVAVFGRYDGEFDLNGRLAQPPEVLHDLPTALAWAKANPAGAVVSFFRGGILHLPERPLYLGHAEDFRAALWASTTVTASGGAVLRPRF